jgi:leader peptidase (prepilin peptidase)/N-methyltransferase
MTHLDTAVVAAVISLATAQLVPALIARLPEPDLSDEPDVESVAEGPKELYVDVAASPGLLWKCAVAGALAGGLAGFALGWVWALLFVLFLVPVGVALAIVDHRTRLLPTRIVNPATLVVAVLVVVCWALDRDLGALERAGIGLVVARAFFWLLWRVHSSGMGFGDVRLAGMLGCALGYLGWPELVVGLYSGFLVFGLPGLLLAVVRRDRAVLRTAFPFGPFMLVGALVGVVVGEPLVASLVAG